MDAGRMARTLSRIAHEILERHPDPRRLALVGVRSRGVPLARRLARLFADAAGSEPAVGAIDISLYRDDASTARDDLLTLVLEVTGEAKKEKQAKVATAEQLWTVAVNNWGGLGRWAFIEVTDPWDAEHLIRAKHVQLAEATSRG
jgi:hypothetical protein